ncbi:hypothetical protein ZWY2020_045597 [Hordeum vulgare]|nr:hypothetical protein ZWY2020_045597 [Hordeum vulgare]
MLRCTGSYRVSRPGTGSMGKRNKVEDDRAAGELACGATSCLPEILREILSRVLYRSLCRFTYVRASVSKAWVALCSDLAVRTAGGRRRRRSQASSP